MIYLVIGAACIFALLIYAYGEKNERLGQELEKKRALENARDLSEELNAIETEIDRADDTTPLRDELHNDWNDK